MELNITNRLPKTATNACQLIFLYQDGKLKGQSRKINTGNDGLIKKLYESKDFLGKTGETLLLHGVGNYQRVLLAGLGDRSEADAHSWKKACIAAATTLCKTPSSSVLSDCLSTTTMNGLKLSQAAEILVTELVNANYAFTLHARQEPHTISPLKSISLSCERSDVTAIEASTTLALATGNGMALAKDLGNLAPNICTPDYLAGQAKDLADHCEQLSVDILDENAMHELGMGALLAVSAGSEEEARLIVMNYQGKKRAGSPVVLIGKGVTFDTGGISIKSSDGMDEMKYDMCGAASVFGVMQALAEWQPDINVIGVVAAAENMPDGRATRPGDVITTLSGKTVEILNTDAEGRLVLCDAITYVQRFKPAAVIDIATLTGAAVTALGHHMSAVFGNHQSTIDALFKAGQETGDQTWPMPMGPDYQEQLKSNFADLANIGGRPAGAITAACFLASFAQDMNWAHLDIAGVAWNSGKQKGATGRPVPLLLKYIEQQAISGDKKK